MHLHRYPNSNSYYFATNPGYEHQSVCKEYAGRKDAPVLDRISPEELVAMISKLPVKKRVSTGGGGGNVDREGEEDDVDVEYNPRRITSLLQMLKTGMYDENPFDRTGLDSNHIIMDYVVFDKWPKYVCRCVKKMSHKRNCLIGGRTLSFFISTIVYADDSMKKELTIRRMEYNSSEKSVSISDRSVIISQEELLGNKTLNTLWKEAFAEKKKKKLSTEQQE